MQRRGQIGDLDEPLNAPSGGVLANFTRVVAANAQ
jgi:hypothetical protein